MTKKNEKPKLDVDDIREMLGDIVEVNTALGLLYMALKYSKSGKNAKIQKNKKGI